MLRLLKQKQQQGFAAIFIAASMGVLLTLAAFTVDLGMSYAYKTTLQNAVDTALRAGMTELASSNSQNVSQTEAQQYFDKNIALNTFMDPDNTHLYVYYGNWEDGKFEETDDDFSAMRVIGTYDTSYIFAKLLGFSDYTVEAEAIAAINQNDRDIAIVFDISASMNNDSQLDAQETSQATGTLTRAEIEAHVYQLFLQLKALSNSSSIYPYLADDDNDISTFEDYYGYLSFPCDLQFSSSDYYVDVAEATGLAVNTPAYYGGYYLSWIKSPFPGLSYSQYFAYMRSSTSDLTRITGNPYQYCFSYMTLIHYLLLYAPRAVDTPNFYELDAQPIASSRNAINVFLDELAVQSPNDRVALITFPYSDKLGHIDHGLTASSGFDAIKETVRTRQAGHYLRDYYAGNSNLYAAIESAIYALNPTCSGDDPQPISSRQQTIILVSDGTINMYRTGYDAQGEADTLAIAELAAACNISVDTVSVGGRADHDMMEEIADAGNGVHYPIIGNLVLEENSQQLEDTFIAFGQGNGNEIYTIVK